MIANPVVKPPATTSILLLRPGYAERLHEYRRAVMVQNRFPPLSA